MKTNLQRRQQGSGNNGAGAFFGKQSGGDAFFSKNSPERREIDRGSQGVHRAQRMVAPPPPSTPAIQRTISEEQLPRTPVSRIMSDGSYFENNITRIEYFTAELAILHYNDGTQLRLGLVPEYIQAPIEG
ncbi:MAG: hypothetical protein KDD02_06770, partial [Phaeodactylibacter sp.]|nr:hypothetical protein [Phaeodactylibacter sp.]